MDITAIKTLMNVKADGTYKTAINKTSGYVALGKDGNSVVNVGNHWYNFFYRPSQNADQNRRTREAIANAFSNSGFSDETMKMVRNMLGLRLEGDPAAERPLNRRFVKKLILDMENNEVEVKAHEAKVKEAQKVVNGMVSKTASALMKSFPDRVLAKLREETGFVPEENSSDSKFFWNRVMCSVRDGVIDCALAMLHGNLTRDEAMSKLSRLYDDNAHVPAGLKDEDKAFSGADKLTAGVVRKLNAILKEGLKDLLDTLEARREEIAREEAKLLNDPYKEYGDMSDSDLSE